MKKASRWFDKPTNFSDHPKIYELYDFTKIFRICTDNFLQFEFKDGAFELLSVARPSNLQALPFVEKFAKNFYVKYWSTYE